MGIMTILSLSVLPAVRIVRFFGSIEITVIISKVKM